MTEKDVHPDEEIVGEIPYRSKVKAIRATDSMPVIGGLVVVMGQLYRCVEVRYADGTETQTGVAELRIRYKQEDGDG